MAVYGVSFVVTYVAWDTTLNAGKTGDVANHTLRWVKDGVSAAPTNAPSEVDATNLPGLYKLTMTATEAQATFGALGGKSSTGAVSIMPVVVAFERFALASDYTSARASKLDNLDAPVSTAATPGDVTVEVTEATNPPTRRRVVAN